MSLQEENKAERRDRIIAAARKLVVTKGYDGLTMRDLARAARVSVPTLYNLFGGKDAILMAALAASAGRIAARVMGSGGSFFRRGMATFEAGMEMIAEAPELHRALMRMALTSPETAPMRRRAEAGYIAVMVGILTAAKAAGQLAAWAEPPIVARHLLTQYLAYFLGWGLGVQDWKSFRATALSGVCHLLAGVARGAFADEVEAFIHTLQREAALPSTTEVGHVASRSD